jgi:hypothetical protein
VHCIVCEFKREERERMRESYLNLERAVPFGLLGEVDLYNRSDCCMLTYNPKSDTVEE